MDSIKPKLIDSAYCEKKEYKKFLINSCKMKIDYREKVKMSATPETPTLPHVCDEIIKSAKSYLRELIK